MIKNVISFSGGKDSWALLYLLEPLWEDSAVVWCNTGAAYEETLEQMKRVRDLVPHFVEVRSDVLGFVRTHGFPVDVVPAWDTSFAARGVAGAQAKFCSPLECCAANMWLPMQETVKRLGATTVYRGQKHSDQTRSTIDDGHVEDGVVYRFPLAAWTDADVFAYLGDRVPDYYARGEQSSRDCWMCTAYLDKNATRIAHLPPAQRMVVTDQLRLLMKKLDASRAEIAACIGGVE